VNEALPLFLFEDI